MPVGINSIRIRKTVVNDRQLKVGEMAEMIGGIKSVTSKHTLLQRVHK